MDKLIGLVSSPQQSASPTVAAQALNRAAQKRGTPLAIETRSALGVQHPLSAAELSFEAPLPEDLRLLLAALRQDLARADA